MDVLFKKATEKDIALIRELADKSWRSAYREILSEAQINYMLEQMYSVEEISDQLRNPHYHYYLIYNSEIAAGFIGFENHSEPLTAKLHRIYLIPEEKGKGLGKAALNFVKNSVEQSDDNRIILSVNKNNQARKIYESEGFSVYAEAIVDIGNGFVMDDYLMEFKL